MSCFGNSPEDRFHFNKMMEECTEEIYNDDDYCAICGTELEEDNQGEKYCPECDEDEE